MSKARISTNWFSHWRLVPAGPGGDQKALACPHANKERPDKTPECYLAVPEHAVRIDELQAMARIHRVTHGC